MPLENPVAAVAKAPLYRGEWGEVMEAFPWLQYQIAGVQAWLWVTIPALFIAAYILTRFLLSFLMLVADTLKLVEHKWLKRYVFSITNPLALLIATMIFNGLQAMLPIPGSTEGRLSYFNATIYTLSITWILIVYSDATLESIRRRLMREGRATSAALIPLFHKITNTALVLLAILFLLQNLGFDVAALIAALGVGGIAVALASQKSVENLLGGIMISLDQPIRIGDFGKFGDVFGTVEDIGLRSTKIRTLERTILSIPNAEMAAMRLENYSARDKMLFKHVIGLRYETDADQLRYIVMKIKDMLLAHPMVLNEPAKPRFVRFGASSLDIEINAYIRTNDKDKADEVQEDLLLRIKDIVAEAGSDFAFPSQTLYMERGRGLDREKQEEVRQEVEVLRAKGDLQWPNPTALHAKQVANTIDYPPEGSAG